MTTALITANVFHNSLSSLSPDAELYTEYLYRLSLQAVTWYMSELDLRSIDCFWDMFRPNADRICQEAYLTMRSRVRVCRVDALIQEEMRRYRLFSVSDAIRLACAIDRNVDAIVTWEPHHFARNHEEEQESRRVGHFLLKIPAEEAESHERHYHTLGVYSARAFLLTMSNITNVPIEGVESPGSFQIDTLQIVSGDADGLSTAEVTLQHLCGRELQDRAQGSSLINVLQQAVDRCVNRCVHLPKRRISRFDLSGQPLYGADAPVQVTIGVECNGHSYEASATSISVFRAAADAYIKIINRLCDGLDVH